MSKELSGIISQIEFEPLPQNFLIVSILLNQYRELINNLKKFEKDFYSIILEEEEITLIVSDKNWEKIKSNFNKCKIESNWY